MTARRPGLDPLLIESGGDNLAAAFGPDLVDAQTYVIDVSERDKITRNEWPGSPSPTCSSSTRSTWRSDTIAGDGGGFATLAAGGVPAWSVV
jgi:hypothetical protein